MRQVSGLAHLRGAGVLVFTLAVLALFATPASASAVPGTYTVRALVSNNGVQERLWREAERLVGESFLGA